MDYWEIYQRNIGLFSRENQESLRSAKVTIAGVGGVGGVEASTLARFGIGELSIMDPGVFDEPDMNRQFAAMKSTLGENKARATARMLKDINPFLKLNVLEHAPTEAQELKEFMKGSQIVIDAIDYSGFHYKALFARTARELGQLNITAPIPGFGTLMVIFDPHGMTMEDFYEAPADPKGWPDFTLALDRILGEQRYGELPRRYRSGETRYLPVCAGAASLNGGLVATEVALIVTKHRRWKDIVFAPQATYVDMLRRVFEVYDARSDGG
jgi:hypothetical protein